jgi:hypothetical protein
MKDTFYFSHDYNTRTDDKIKPLLRKHGMLGYGIFWAIIEDLYNNANALRTDYEGIAYDLHSDENIVKSIINDFDLFVFNDGFFGSLSVQKRIDERNEKSEKARKSAYYKWNKDANAKRTQSERIEKGYEGNAIYKEKEINEINISFDIFWNLYEKKIGDKAKLIKKWEKLTDEERQNIINYIPKYKESQPNKKYRKNPDTFFNNKSWNDELINMKEMKPGLIKF